MRLMRFKYALDAIPANKSARLDIIGPIQTKVEVGVSNSEGTALDLRLSVQIVLLFCPSECTGTSHLCTAVLRDGKQTLCITVGMCTCQLL